MLSGADLAQAHLLQDGTCSWRASARTLRGRSSQSSLEGVEAAALIAVEEAGLQCDLSDTDASGDEAGRGRERAARAAVVLGARLQSEVDERLEAVQEEVARSWAAQVQLGEHSEGLVLGGQPVTPERFRAPAHSKCPEPVELAVYTHCPPCVTGERPPALLYLHGKASTQDIPGSLRSLAYETWWVSQAPEDLVVLVPQLPSEKQLWIATAVKETLLFIMEQAVERGCDPTRLYVAGHSMGGFGAWDLAADSACGRAPFAAAITCGAYLLDLNQARSLKDFPLWCFHGQNDATNHVSEADKSVAALVRSGANKAGGRAGKYVRHTLRYTRYEWSPAFAPGNLFGEGHMCNLQAFADPDLFDWLTRQSRSAPAPPRTCPDDDCGASKAMVLPGARAQDEVDLRWNQTVAEINETVQAAQRSRTSGGLVVDTHGTGMREVEPLRVLPPPGSSGKVPNTPLDTFVFMRRDGKKTQLRPCVLFLHGTEGCADTAGVAGLQSQSWWLRRLFLEDARAVVLVPQLPSTQTQWLTPWVKCTLLHLLRRATREFGVDPERIHVAGVGTGASAALELAAEEDSHFAAAVAVAMGTNGVASAARLAQFPTWFFHGANDAVHPVSNTDEAVAAMLRAGANRGQKTLRYTRYQWSPDVVSSSSQATKSVKPPRLAGHGAQEQAFGEPELFPWLLAQSKAVSLARAVVGAVDPKYAKWSCHDAEPDDEDAAVWAVVGGTSCRGLLVRRGRDVNSQKLAWLSAGALVQQIELVGKRLNFKRLKGQGPDYGWVSISHHGADVLLNLRPAKEGAQAPAPGSAIRCTPSFLRAGTSMCEALSRREQREGMGVQTAAELAPLACARVPGAVAGC